jgi:hypothetical protein
MTKRLQVLMEESEFELVREVARRHRVSVGEWVRQAIRSSCFELSSRPAEARIRAVQEALLHSFPTGDVDQMNREIEIGYANGLP